MLGSRLLHGCVLKKLARRFTVIMCMTFYNGVSVAGGGGLCVRFGGDCQGQGILCNVEGKLAWCIHSCKASEPQDVAQVSQDLVFLMSRPFQV